MIVSTTLSGSKELLDGAIERFSSGEVQDSLSEDAASGSVDSKRRATGRCERRACASGCEQRQV